MRTEPRVDRKVKWFHDVAFITGVYVALMLLLFVISSVMALFSDEIPQDSFYVLSDLLFILSSFITILAAMYIGMVRSWLVFVVLTPLVFFLADSYIFLREYNVQYQFVLKFDYWSFMVVALVVIKAFFRTSLKRHEYFALIGWSIYVFGHILLSSIDWELVGFITFAPLIGALVFWVPALWLGSKQFSSR